MALTLDAAKWRKKRGMRRLLDALGADEGLTRYVGGAIRDDLLGLPISDIDLATRISPQEVIRRLEEARIKAVPTGIDHGTITAISDGHPFEITTLRRDVSTDGRRATVAFTDDWKEDAARRDFTINALSADPVTGELFDYFGGLDDLQQHHIRFIGDPLQRIAEDHLRILRFFRFHARFDRGEPDAAALAACTARANDLMALSRERIADELLKLLAMANPARTVRLMVKQGIFTPVLPEIGSESTERLERLVDFEKAAGLAPDPIRRLAALLVGPPELGRSVAARLRLSKKQAGRLAAALEPSTGSPFAQAYRSGIEAAVDRIALAGDPQDARAPTLTQLQHWHVPRLPISGGALIERGLPEGPIVARTLRKIEDRWVEAGFPSGAEFDLICSEELARAA